MGKEDTGITVTPRQIMLTFAEESGLTAAEYPNRRYLWTDAHAVCNFLSLYARTRDDRYKTLARDLVEQVHAVLGKHRDDDPRSGWISGLQGEEGSNHPTIGGLRIGKKLRERGRYEEFNERLEWERDGQYFHYLTKWMHALCRASSVTGEERYCRWALELARAAHDRFTFTIPGTGARRLFWKMSIDLSFPQVPSSGLHDPLDAYITYHEIAACAENRCTGDSPPGLEAELAEAAAMIERQRWQTDDPLGLGGLLFDMGRVLQLSAAAQLDDANLVADLVNACTESLHDFVRHARLTEPPEYRLAFRELGLSIGLRAVPMARRILADRPGLFPNRLQHAIDGLTEFLSLGEDIEQFWIRPDSQGSPTWLEHLDINRVMLATSLLPDEFLNVT